MNSRYKQAAEKALNKIDGLCQTIDVMPHVVARSQVRFEPLPNALQHFAYCGQIYLTWVDPLRTLADDFRCCSGGSSCGIYSFLQHSSLKRVASALWSTIAARQLSKLFSRGFDIATGSFGVLSLSRRPRRSARLIKAEISTPFGKYWRRSDWVIHYSLLCQGDTGRITK